MGKIRTFWLVLVLVLLLALTSCFNRNSAVELSLQDVVDLLSQNIDGAYLANEVISFRAEGRGMSTLVLILQAEKAEAENVVNIEFLLSCLSAM